MKIREIEISNFRSLKKIRMDKIGDYVVLIGKNGSGKSNLLEALELFFSDLNFQGDSPRTLVTNNWFDKFTSKPIEFKIVVELNPEELLKISPNGDGFELELHPNPENRLLYINRHLITNTWKNNQIYFSDNIKIDNSKVLRKKDETELFESLSPEISNTILSNLNSLLKNNFKLVKGPRESPERQPTLTRTPTIDPESKTYYQQMCASQERSMELLWNGCQEDFKKFTGHDLQVRNNLLEFKVGDLTLPIDSSGSGDQALLVLLRQFHEEKQIYGIEEPETRLHNNYIRKISEFFRDMSKLKQIFVATHSTVMVDKSNFQDVWYVSIKNKETSIKSLGSKELESLLLDLGIKPSDIFLANKILLVEGATEAVVILKIAQKIDLNISNISIIPINGKSKANRHLALWSEITSGTTLETYLLLDKDAKKEADEVIKSNKILNTHCHVLDKPILHKSGQCDIEDYYTKGILEEIINEMAKINSEVPNDIAFSKDEDQDVVQQINKYLGRKDWKMEVGKNVIEKMSSDDIERDMNEIIKFLKKVIG